jgi:hypothetical protein
MSRHFKVARSGNCNYYPLDPRGEMLEVAGVSALCLQHSYCCRVLHPSALTLTRIAPTTTLTATVLMLRSVTV